MNNEVKIFSGTKGKALARAVSQHLGLGDPAAATVARFSDDEIRVELDCSIRGSDVYIINPTNPPAENLLELVLLADAAHRASSGRITLIPSYLGYNRQDRKDRPRVPLSAKVAAKMLSIPEVDRVILLDPHSDPTIGFFDDGIIVDRLYASYIAIPYLKGLLAGRNFVVASPDKGGGPRAEAYAQRLGRDDYVVFTKSRPEPGSIDRRTIKIIGDVDCKDVLFVDDMIDSAGTITADAAAARDAGARNIYCFATHALFSGSALKAIEESPIDEVIFTDSIPPDESLFSGMKTKMTVLPCAPLIAEAINTIIHGRSMSELFV